MPHETNWKPSPLTRALLRFARLTGRRSARKAAQRAARLDDAAIRLVCFTRDKGACRICGLALKFQTDNPLKLAHNHHIVYRSAGGSSAAENRITLCAMCHEDEHQHKIVISGTATDLRVTRRPQP